MHTDHRSFAASILTACLLLCVEAAGQNATTVSRHSDGTYGDDHSGKQGVAISADGRHIAFVSDATNLVAADTNGLRDIFVRDRTLGTTTCLSVDATNTPVGAYVTNFGGTVYEIAISSSGRYVTFQSWAPWLVTGDTNARQDIFVVDRDVDDNGTYDEGVPLITRVNLSTTGDQASSGHSGETGLAMSGSGLIICYDSLADNLVPDDTGFSDIFIRDVAGGLTELISVTWDDDEADESSGSPAMSSDGMHVAFTSLATNLVSVADTNFAVDVFVRDRTTGSTVRVSVASDGTEANDDSFKPAISGTGRYVVFGSSADNLVATDTNLRTDIFLHDRDADENGTFDETFVGARKTVNLSLTAEGVQSNHHERLPWISRDGRFVSFKTDSDNMIPGDTNFVSEIVVYDRDWDEDGIYDESGATGLRRLLTAGGVQAFDDVGAGVGSRISDDGRYIVVPTLAKFESGDTAGNTDVVVTDVGADGPAPVHYCTSTENSHTVGNGAMIGYQGSASVGNNDLILCSTQAPSGQFGIFYYGGSRISLPFGNGFRCAGGGITRLPVVTTGASGYVTYTLDNTVAPHSTKIVAGSSWNFQFWFRDPPAGGAEFNLSHGLGISFGP